MSVLARKYDIMSHQSSRLEKVPKTNCKINTFFIVLVLFSIIYYTIYTNIESLPIVINNCDNIGNTNNTSFILNYKYPKNDYNINYYLLYGYCSKGNNMYLYHYIIMDKFKQYISNNYPHWIILNISIESFLDNLTSSNYTHELLINFTKLKVPFININIDKFQWIFEPSCEGHYLQINLKEYYHKNRLLLNTITIPMPINICKYIHNNNNSYSNICIDDDERETYSHITNINYHKYSNKKLEKEYILNISNNIKLSNIWQQNIYFSSTIKYLQSLCNNRPLLFAMSGEVFDNWVIRKRNNCQSNDIHIQRTKSWPRKGCIIISYIQGILQKDMTYTKQLSSNAKYVWNLMDFNPLIVDKFDVDKIFKTKSKFCSFTVKAFMLYGRYFPDALVRHVLHSMISRQYKQCDMLGYYHNNVTDINYLCDELVNR
eukprot:103046_1